VSAASLATQSPLSGVSRVVSSSGQPLPGGTRAAVERRLGHDFSNVRIHTDREAAESARSVGATAYTVGRHVVFGAGAWQPETTAGQATLTHELVHTVQQGSTATTAVSRRTPGPPTIVPVDDATEREAERIAGNLGGREPIRGPPSSDVLLAPLPGNLLIQRQVTAPSAPPPSAPPPSTQAAPSAAQRCADLLADTSSEAVRELTRAIDVLIAFEADLIFPLAPGDPGIAEHRRVAAHLTATFNTTAPFDVQAITGRLARIRRALSNNEIRMSCNTGCASGVGGSVLQGHSPGPFQFTLCGTNATPARLAPTLIHESAHAVLPDIGTGSRPASQSTSGVIDRAYDQERLFTHLSPTEALTNAESYSGLVVGLTSGAMPPASAASRDTVTACADRAPIEAGLGRAQVAARLLASWMRGAAELLRDSGETDVATVGDPSVPDLRAAFPGVRTLADLQKLRNDASVVFNNFSNPESVRCASRVAACPPGRLGFVYDTAVTATGQSRLAPVIDRSGIINVCPAWLGASDADRARTMYAMVAAGYLGGAMVQLLTPADAMKLATLAVQVTARYHPAPLARSAAEHLFR
jgi:hypothetical protein